MNDDNTVHKGSCYCGAVGVTVQGPPAAALFCHCGDCRKWHSAPIAAISIWPNANVTIDGPTIVSQVDEGSGRTSCSKCGGCVAIRKPAFDMTGVYAMTLSGSDQTYKFEPGFHIFYNERVMEVNDGLPKFADLPEPFGGSGNTVAESGGAGWR